MLYRIKFTLTRENSGFALQWHAMSLKHSSKLLRPHLKSSGRADEQRFPSTVSRAKTYSESITKLLQRETFYLFNSH